jgi:hypothetical protein
MATDQNATIVKLHQPTKKPLSPAERARNYRLRKKAKLAVTPVAITPPVTPQKVRVTSPVTLLLVTAAFALAAVGVTMNAWFARSLGSSDVAGWLFLAIGAASDMVALAVPSIAARLWGAGRRGTALAAWAVFAMTFTFAVTAGVGFSSTNIADVTMARASRVTPAVETARSALADAMTARDRECRGGVGKFCREREAAVSDRRAALDSAMQTVAETGDPQAAAAVRMVRWLSGGMVRPTEEDFALLRLVLLAVLPQIGGILLMIGRAK